MIEKLHWGKKLILPKKEYGPFCLKILKEFIEHHDLSKDLEFPEKDLPMHLSLSRIFDAMTHSMGHEKRKQILIELDKYIMDIPAHFRN